jgi:hypothetical protein
VILFHQIKEVSAALQLSQRTSWIDHIDNLHCSAVLQIVHGLCKNLTLAAQKAQMFTTNFP